MGLKTFNQDHKNLLIKVTSGSEVCFPLSRIGVFAFFCKYSRRWRDKR
jgi:hypothetical protein